MKLADRLSLGGPREEEIHPQPIVGSGLSLAEIMSVTRKERRAAGKTLSDKCAKETHASWKPRTKRRDPIDLLIKSSTGRMPQLVPIRYGRMMQSPFAFYRASTAIRDGRVTTFKE